MSLTVINKDGNDPLIPAAPHLIPLRISDDRMGIMGSRLADWIIGNGLNNRINGEIGADTMQGLAGNDVYWVDNPGDVVIEKPGEGKDRIITPLSYTLPDNMESLRLIGQDNVSVEGNALNNILIGNHGNNRLDGGEGWDRVSYRYASQPVVVNLNRSEPQTTGDGNDTPISIEGLIGSPYADQLTGNAGNNALKGMAGNDTLAGGAGFDTLTGGAGRDCFVLSDPEGVTHIMDFTHNVDCIRIDQILLPVGNGDNELDHAEYVQGLQTFSPGDEWVRFANQINGRLTAESATALIRYAARPFDYGHTAIFLANNGVNTGVFYFTARNGNDRVSAWELTLIGVVSGTEVDLGDFELQA